MSNDKRPQNEFDLRGLLASKLSCWHRLTGAESDELVAFVARLEQPEQEPIGCQHKRYSVDAREGTGACHDCGAEGRMQFVVGDTSSIARVRQLECVIADLKAECKELRAAQPAPSQYGSPELQAMVVARAIEKDRAEQPAPVQHPDDLAVDRFATAMKAKMAKQRAKGYGGWDDPEQCPADRLQTMLVDHLTKGDPVDIGNFAMMLWNRGENTSPPAQPASVQEPVEMSPEFTDTARSALLWVLWHHQGGSSPVGQPIRFALGMDAHERLSAKNIEDAKRWAKQTGSTTAEFHTTPPAVQELPVNWAAMIHYPDCWGTAAYPELRDAIHEALAWFGCSVCEPPAGQPAVPLTDERIDKAAMKLAECMDYPWAQMPEQGRQSMRDHAKAIVEASGITEKGGA